MPAVLSPTLENLLGLAATLFALGTTVPQFLRLRRSRTAAGVSVVGLANSTVSGTAWTVFGVVEGHLWVALPAVVTLPATVGAIAVALRQGASRAGLWLPVAWAGTILAAAAASALVGPGPITVVLGCSLLLLVGPAALTAWRSHDVAAVAPVAWWLLVADGVLSGAFGVVAGVPANVLYGVVAVIGSAAVLVRLALPAAVHARLVPHAAPASLADLELAS